MPHVRPVLLLSEENHKLVDVLITKISTYSYDYDNLVILRSLLTYPGMVAAVNP